MTTCTIEVGPSDHLVATCNIWELAGWSVRQIVPNSGYTVSYVVFEADPTGRPDYAPQPPSTRVISDDTVAQQTALTSVSGPYL
jgi:hypothetical protein